MKTYNSKIQFLALLLLLISVVCKDTVAQQINRINDKIGGSGSTSSNVSQSDDTFLYIVGGVVIAAIIVYGLTRDKKEVKSEEDSTKASLKPEMYKFNNLLITNTKNKINPLPVDLYFGFKNTTHFIDTKKYILGIRLNL